MITTFSVRGPGGDFLKPDVTEPGLHILAGTTPTPESPLEGPPGNLYLSIAGTSMSSPHVAGAAALLFALHPTWTPGQVKTALETTAKTSITKQDGATPADGFDKGGGRIDLSRAGDTAPTPDESAENFAASAADPLNRIDLNLPSANATTMPGVITAKRTFTNVTGKSLTYTATGTTVSGASILVVPPLFTVTPGKTQTVQIARRRPGGTPPGRCPRRSAVQIAHKVGALGLQFLDRALDDVADADDADEAAVLDDRDVPEPVHGHGLA